MHIVFFHHGGHNGGGFLSLLYLLKQLVEHVNITLINSCSNTHVREHVEKLGIRVIDFEMTRAPHIAVGLFRFTNPIYAYSYYIWKRNYPSTCDRLHKLLLSLNPDIVHLNSLTFLHYAPVAKSIGIPIVLHIREHSSRGFLGLTRMLTNKLINKYIDYTIFICKDYLYEYGDLNIPHTVLYNPTPEGKFYPIADTSEYRKGLQIPEDAVVVFFPGGADPEIKGLSDFVDAMNLYKGSRILYAIIPSFEMTNDVSLRELQRSLFKTGIKKIPSNIWGILRLKRRLDISNKIRNSPSDCGYVFPKFSFDVEEYYAVSDIVFILHKLPHYSRCVLESGAMRKPVIAYNTPGVRELLFDGLNAITIKQNEIGDVAKALETLSSDSELRLKLEEGGFMLNKTIRMSITIDRLLQIYRNTIHSIQSSSV